MFQCFLPTLLNHPSTPTSTCRPLITSSHPGGDMWLPLENHFSWAMYLTSCSSKLEAAVQRNSVLKILNLLTLFRCCSKFFRFVISDLKKITKDVCFQAALIAFSTEKEVKRAYCRGHFCAENLREIFATKDSSLFLLSVHRARSSVCICPTERVIVDNRYITLRVHVSIEVDWGSGRCWWFTRVLCGCGVLIACLGEKHQTVTVSHTKQLWTKVQEKQ